MVGITSEQFVTEVKEGLDLCRKGQYRGLGGLPELSSLRLLRTSVPPGHPNYSAVYLGQKLREIIHGVIEDLKPGDSSEDLNDNRWRIYLLLRDYFKRGKSREEVSEIIGLGYTAFHELKRSAGEAVAAKLQEMEERMFVLPKSNLVPPPFMESFIERHNWNQSTGRPVVMRSSKDESLVEIILEMVGTTTRIIALEGPAGVGKTALAYEVAKRCQDRGRVEAIIWASAKKDILMVRAPYFALVPCADAIVSCSDILCTICSVLGQSKILSGSQSFVEKVRTVCDCMASNNCLVVIDNMETFNDEAKDQLYNFLNQVRGASTFLLTSRPLYDLCDRNIAVPVMSCGEASELIRRRLVIRGLSPLDDTNEGKIYCVSQGNPLVIRLIIDLMAGAGFSVDQAIAKYEEPSETISKFGVSPSYERLHESSQYLLHMMSIFANYQVSMFDIVKASPLMSGDTQDALGELVNFSLIEKLDGHYRLPSLVWSFLKEGGVSLLKNISAESKFMAEAYIRLANLYVGDLLNKSLDEVLLLMKDERKWLMIRVLQGLRALADHSREIEGVRYFDVLDLYTSLFDLIGFPLSVFNLNNERLRWAEEAVVICEMRGCERKAACFKVFDIGWVHLHNGNTDKAREIIANNLSLAEEKGYPEVEAIALYNRGRIFRDIDKDYKEASSDLEKALRKWPDDPKYTIWKTQTMSSLGLVAYQMGNFPLALGWLEESLKIRQELGFRNLIVEGRSDVALVQAALGNTPDSLRLSDSAISIGQGITPPSCSYGYSQMRRGQIEKDFLRRKDKALVFLQRAHDTYRVLGAQLMVTLVNELLKDL